MVSKDKPRRRWLSYSLRTLLLVMTVLCVPLAAWMAYVEPYRVQRKAAAVIQKVGGTVQRQAGGPEWMRELFGDEHFQDIVFVNLANSDISPALMECLVKLSRLETLAVAGLCTSAPWRPSFC